MQKYGFMASTEVNNDFICEICGETNKGFNWSDYHGEGMCNICGTPYQIVQYDENNKRLDIPPKIKIKPEWIPVLSQYWNETKKYMGLGTIMIGRDYPECVEGRQFLNEWLDNHKDLIPKEKEEGGDNG